MANEVYNLYRKYLSEPMDYRLGLGKIAYRKAKEKMQTRMNSWDAFNGAICLSLMCLCGDGNFICAYTYLTECYFSCTVVCGMAYYRGKRKKK